MLLFILFAVAVLPTSGDITQHTHACGTYVTAKVGDHASAVRNENIMDKAPDYAQTGKCIYTPYVHTTP